MYGIRYDLTNTNWNIDEDISDLKNFHGNVPDIVLVRKVGLFLSLICICVFYYVCMYSLCSTTETRASASGT